MSYDAEFLTLRVLIHHFLNPHGDIAGLIFLDISGERARLVIEIEAVHLREVENVRLLVIKVHGVVVEGITYGRQLNVAAHISWYEEEDNLFLISPLVVLRVCGELLHTGTFSELVNGMP